VLNRSQSPYRNIYPAGRLGIHAPNRGEYDGFGLTLPDLKPGEDGKLHASLDFRCADQQAGGGGSWRYYLGHGAGNSAAVELFFNGSTFFRKSGGSIDPVGPIEIRRWYQVQVSLDLKQKTYSGSLASDAGTISFTGELASNWDGLIDYTFVDSYGHLGGVRPAIDIDQFAISGQPFPAINQPATELGDSGQPVSTRREQVASLRTKLAEMQASAAALAAEYRRMLAEGPAPMAYGVVEGTPHDAVIQQRGEPDRPGEQVRRGFLNVLGGQPLPPDARGSGRRELADWLTKPQNPLTARVMVNRIWQYHFGRGLVQTPNDFGVRGMPPTDPALLDHLATRFVREGWSIKAMHRLIMNSSTYQQAAVASASDSSDSPAGFPSRRLSAEEIRDAILLVAGTLDRSPANGHPFPSPLDWGYSQHGPFLAVYDHNKRGIYLMSQRLKRHPFLGLFDGADPNASTAERRPTTVPTQALFFLNDPLIHATSEAWAGRLMAASPTEPERIEEAWRQALGRSPSAAERAEAESFLSAYQAELAAGSAPAMKNSARLALAAYLRTLLASNEFLHLN